MKIIRKYGKKSILNKLEGIGCIVLGFFFTIGIIITYIGFASGINTIIWLGLLIIFPFIIYFLYWEINIRISEKKERNKLKKFKTKAKKIIVNLEDIEIDSNKWYENIVVDNSKYSLLNVFVGRGDRNIKTVRRISNFVRIYFSFEGKKMEYSFNTSMEPEAIKMLLLTHKTTTLYIDPDDSGNYYLDLEFLM